MKPLHEHLLQGGAAPPREPLVVRALTLVWVASAIVVLGVIVAGLILRAAGSSLWLARIGWHWLVLVGLLEGLVVLAAWAARLPKRIRLERALRRDRRAWREEVRRRSLGA